MDRSVLYILSKENPACLAEAQQALSRTPGYEVLDIRNYAEALTVVQSGWSGIVVPVI